MVHTEVAPAVYVKLENRPGTLDHATRVLRDRRLNIDAMSLETVGSTGFVRILTPRFREALEALRSERIEAHETQLVLARVENKPGEMHRLASELAAAGINVEWVLTTPDGRLAFRTSDNDMAGRILAKL